MSKRPTMTAGPRRLGINVRNAQVARVPVGQTE